MPVKILEARPGRAQVFFQLLQDIVLLIMGPTASLQGQHFEDDDSLKQVVMAAVAIYAEAALFALIHFVETARFWYLWRKRSAPRSYSRRLRGIGLPNFIVPLRDAITKTQIIPGCSYVCMVLIATVLACVIGVPVIVISEGRWIFDVGRDALLSISLFLLITIGTGGNVLAGLIFLIERLDNEGVIELQSKHVQVALPVLYLCWLLFQSVVSISRTLVYLSSSPALRALARIYLLPVTLDIVVSTKEHRADRIDEGVMYINLRQDYDEATINIGKERENQQVTLDQISKIC